MRRGTKARRHALDTAWAASRVQGGRGAAGDDALRAFTLVELLVVIAVIGVLVTLLVAVGAQIVGGQKASTTKNVMRNVGLAIDQFAAEDPLKGVYNSKNRKAFGAYPPYQLYGAVDGDGTVDNVREALEPPATLWSINAAQYTLENRLWRDVGNSTLSMSNWVELEDDRANDDIRALYAYLALYTPGVLSQIPEANIKPLVPGTAEFVNPTGSGPAPGLPGSTWVDVFGIYDAWGVPLDYFLQVKLEYKVGADGITQTWVVTDRVPVLRSRGVSRELADAGRDTQNDWIFSEVFPQPAAGLSNPVDGTLPTPLPPAQSRYNGWVRAVAGWGSGPEQRESYGYVPEED